MNTLDRDIYKEICRILPMGILLVDSEGYIYEWNHWLSTKTNISRKQALGNTIKSLYPDIDTLRFQFALEQVIMHQHPQIMSQILNQYLIPIPLPSNDKEHDIRYMQQSISLFPLTTKRQKLALIVITDVTNNYYQRHSLIRTAKQFENESIRDELTGTYNRRFLWEYFTIIISQASREHNVLVCTIFDLDHFKLVNDKYGHIIGDEVLVSFATLIKAALRENDHCFRYGGEEFIILSTIRDPDEALSLANRICKKMAAKQIHGTLKRTITCSAGVAIKKHNQALDANELIRQADQALYQAKREGRNKVCFHTEPEKNQAKSELVNYGYITQLTQYNPQTALAIYSLFLETNASMPLMTKDAFTKLPPRQLISELHKLATAAKAVGANPLSNHCFSLAYAIEKDEREDIHILQSALLPLFNDTVKDIQAYLKTASGDESRVPKRRTKQESSK